MALYHTYRPQNFSAIVGQKHITETLSAEVKNNKIAHAYLFSGPRGIGKTTIARVLAKALNCKKRKNGKDEPCDSCDSCDQIRNSRALDVIEIDAASHTGVDNVRTHIIEQAQFHPAHSPYKIFIIDEVHMLSTSAFNALLKTMEEPPAHVVFILATTELHKIPETIVSRCQRFNFDRISYKELSKHLEQIAKKEGVSLDKEVLDRIVYKSDGCVRDAMSFLDQLMAAGEKKITVEIAATVLPSANQEHIAELVNGLVLRNASIALSALQNILRVHTDMILVFEQTIQTLRYVMIIQAQHSSSVAGMDMNASDVARLEDMAKKISPRDVICLTDILFKRKQQVRTSPVPQLPIEMAIVEWCNTVSGSDGENSNIDDDSAHNDGNIGTEPPEESGQKEEKNSESDSKKKIDILNIRDNWNLVLSKIEQHSPSLVFILKMVTLDACTNNCIALSIPYSFHREKLLEKTNMGRLNQVMSEVFGANISYTVTVQEKQNKPADEQVDDLQGLASLVGGHVLS